MGYSITIGNAVPEFSKEDGELYACWVVEGACSDDAPTFPNDVMTGNSNRRSPSYSGWGDFCRETGLYDLFYKEWEGLIYNHPGCKPITQEHYQEVYDALERYKEKATKLPGFSGYSKWDKNLQLWITADEDKYDFILPRLMWLEFWMKWALENCETPAIRNT